MKLKIVQAVKLGTVACLLAVTTQTIGGENNYPPSFYGNLAAKGLQVPEPPPVECQLETSKHIVISETGTDRLGHKYKLSTTKHCGYYPNTL